MKKVDLECPKCGRKEVYLTLELSAKDLGDFSLAGAQLKFSMAEVPVLTCFADQDEESLLLCEWTLEGKVVGDEAVFDK